MGILFYFICNYCFIMLVLRVIFWNNIILVDIVIIYLCNGFSLGFCCFLKSCCYLLVLNRDFVSFVFVCYVVFIYFYVFFVYFMF